MNGKLQLPENFGLSKLDSFPPAGYPPIGYLESLEAAASNSDYSSFSCSFFSLEDGFHPREDNFSFKLVQPKTGEPVDPRLLAVLAFFREFYDERRELFRKIFPTIHNELAEFFRKLGEIISQRKINRIKVQTMQRSLSLGSPRTPKQGEESTIRLERFKVRTLVLSSGGVQQDKKGEQGTTQPTG